MAENLDYVYSDRTQPIIGYQTDGTVSREIQDIMNDFVFRVFFSSTSAVQQLLALQADRTNARALVSTDAKSSIDVLREVYVDVAPRLSVDSVEAEFVGGSKLLIRIELSLSDDGTSAVAISHTFSTTAG